MGSILELIGGIKMITKNQGVPMEILIINQLLHDNIIDADLYNAAKQKIIEPIRIGTKI